jgi:hypothetical protein
MVFLYVAGLIGVGVLGSFVGVLTLKRLRTWAGPRRPRRSRTPTPAVASTRRTYARRYDPQVPEEFAMNSTVPSSHPTIEAAFVLARKCRLTRFLASELTRQGLSAPRSCVRMRVDGATDQCGRPQQSFNGEEWSR